eukprot:Gb_13498 [translate_table: standard]
MGASGVIFQLGFEISCTVAHSKSFSDIKQCFMRSFSHDTVPRINSLSHSSLRRRSKNVIHRKISAKAIEKGSVSMDLILEEEEQVWNGDKEESMLAEKDELWLQMRREARRDAEAEPTLASYLYSTVLAHRSLERALSFHLGNKLSSSTLLSSQLYNLIADTFMEDRHIRESIRADIKAAKERDPACVSYSQCLLNFKGFLACQAHRVAHRLWTQGRVSLALAIQSRVSEVFAVDIHPAAKIGRGAFFDHATGVVVGETATIGNNVSILHHVTLGGTGKYGSVRHPKIGDGVLIGAGATILGNIRIGEGAKIGAGSVVLIEVPSYTTAVGNPARLVGGTKSPAKLREIPSETMDHTSFISGWSDYNWCYKEGWIPLTLIDVKAARAPSPARLCLGFGSSLAWVLAWGKRRQPPSRLPPSIHPKLPCNGGQEGGTLGSCGLSGLSQWYTTVIQLISNFIYYLAFNLTIKKK